MSETLKRTLGEIIEAGYQVSREGFDLLKALDETLLSELAQYAINRANTLPEEKVILDDSFFKALLEEIMLAKETEVEVTGKGGEPSLAKEYEPEVEVIKNPAEEMMSEGDLKGFLEYFRDRYNRMEKIFKKRIDARDSIPIKEARKTPPKTKIKLMGIIREKRISGNKLFIELEDLESSATVLISLDKEPLRTAQELLLDQIVCVEVLKYNEGLFIADNLLWPDIPDREPNRSEAPLCAALISDLHVGSKLFLGDLFGKFLKWLKMDLGTPESRSLAGRVKYVVIAGDIIDGIGIYPEQEGELEIVDLSRQYEAAVELLSALPDYINLIIIPGNHDAVRNSLPQPAIPQRYFEAIRDDDRVRFLGNPSTVSLHGVEVIVSHGEALNDVLSQVPGLDFHTPAKGMEALLRSRHLAPIYGASTPIAPEKRDWMVIESPPDILQMGHVHIFDYKKYKGTLLVNSGAWQGQTSYQKRLGLTPNPGIAPIVDLQTFKVTPLDFNHL
jgi:DNA polymerase II small subunit